MYIAWVCNTLILLLCVLTLPILAKDDKPEWQAQYEDYILENFDFNEPRITAGAQRWQDARLSRRQAVQGTTSYQQTVTRSFVGTDGYTTVPYATNGQQCSSISRNMNVVYSPNGIQYLYICGGAVSGNINWNYQAPSWSSCMPECDTSNNCTGLSYNGGALYGMQNAAGSGRCTYKTDNRGMTFTTTNTNQLDSTRVAGMQKDVYMRTFGRRFQHLRVNPDFADHGKYITQPLTLTFHRNPARPAI
ncbi:uncharacterized protein MYCFIDRAFT_81178 [Pseudocercospora fijiensis CIRAD86]|uniref:Uncharacterized protein n=1 Tax=Pseudocercospora fijiensis (strain CIRAD86) TaxID=383855 RepID=M2YPN1_PSEFD|nr:uncharacterized protein MYCFIDRAFT_81178 [Pseudocercospora fijiensis CIRAD86]EME79695.1 hypothetical protein MYCFIDRAFT_81178 [Pseudocercospora fijiensis CIRAD86]